MYVITHASGHSKYDEAASTAADVWNFLTRNGYEVKYEAEIDPATVAAELVFAVGGDGTIMRAMKHFKAPVFGINAGTIGFLAGAEANPRDWKPALERVLAGDFDTEHRLALKAITMRDGGNRVSSVEPVANEVALLHDQYPFHTRVSVNDDVMWDRLFARGALVSTATGSPAWNFSSGGQLLFPTSRDVALTPMNPQLASQRPFALPQLALGGTVTLTVAPEKDFGKTIQLVLDGERQEPLTAGDSVIVSAAPEPLLLATFGLPQYFKALRKKGIATGTPL